MKVSPKQERSQIRTIEQLLRRYDLEAIASIKKATENNVTGLNKTMATLEQFIDATVGSLENMQSQIDGSISTWFYEGEPTLENSPANEWISDTEKQAHLGDLYYDKDTGYGYRFSVTEDTYEWIKITDSDVVEALAVANAAQDTADGKRRVFVAKPKPPYDEGDLWFNDEEIYICCVTKISGEYVEDDFIIATKYTDDTKALEVEKNLNLVVARVDILQTTALTAESAVIRELQTNMLTSESAIIKELQTQVTKTETLIFGAAGGTSIQTEFSNAVIAMLGDAQIKSAMIDSVSASKVTSGTILTNDVTIQSEDGKTVLKDNTLQISDGTKVRVQIGKDASGDYSINVWDASGNLMFSEGGITDSAIKEAIIRDDMVSDNANINAAKLDIDSLFEEINGSSKTINSTKVYFDSEKQTLDVLFKSITTEVSELQTTQSSQGTLLTVIQGQITSKVWQSDIDTAVNGVEGDITALSTKYNTLNQTVNGLSSTVGDHTTSISSLGTKVASNESNITQLSNEISLKVDADGIITAINLSKETAKINAKYIDLEGSVTFSSFDEATQTKINTASSNANSALTTANTASTNATSALNRATYHYGTCSTAAGTVAKAVTLSGFSLYTGAMVSVYFTYANTAASPTLNVNGTGAKSIRVNNAAITSKYYWRAKDTVTFVYNGTYWVIADSSANSLLASWCSDNDKALIDGGKIYAKSVTAAQINVEDLFAQDITATGTITGLTYISEGDSASERVEIKDGILKVGSDSTNVSIANGGIGISYNGISSGTIRNNMSGGGIEINVPAGKMFDIACGGAEVLSINKNSSYAGFMNITYPIMCTDIYPGNVDCLDIVCSDVRIRNGVSLSELNSKSIKWIDVHHTVTVGASTSTTGEISYSIPTGSIILNVMTFDISGYAAWRNLDWHIMTETTGSYGIRNLYDTSLTFKLIFRIIYV